MYRYEIKYENKAGKQIKVIRWAESAAGAMQKYAHQHNYSCDIRLVDAETRGLHSCEGYYSDDIGLTPFSFVSVCTKRYE